MEAIDALNLPAVRLSALFNYYTARPDPTVPAALELRDGLRAASQAGICELRLHQVLFTQAGASTRPTAEAVDDAARRRILGTDPVSRRARYWRIDATDAPAWRQVLAARMPLAVGLWATETYRRLTAENPVHGPVQGLASAEGHAVTVLGYEDQRQLFLVKDSRGEQFGAKGYWYLPYALLASGVVHDAWAVEKLSYD